MKNIFLHNLGIKQCTRESLHRILAEGKTKMSRDSPGLDGFRKCLISVNKLCNLNSACGDGGGGR